MQTRTARTSLKVLVTVTYLAMITVNVLANALPINGRTTGAVSDAYQNLFAPAGVTFAIWGVIYLLLGAHVLYQWGLFHDSEPDAHTPTGGETGSGSVASRTDQALLERVGMLFALSSVVNVCWILAWHYGLILVSTLLLVTMLVLLILITRTILSARLSTRDQLFLRLPFSVYFGWITVATIANITVWLVSIGWDGFGITEAVWAVGIIAVGAVIGTTVILRDRDIAYGLVLVWAYLGIWIKHTSDAGFQNAYPAVIASALVGIAAFLAAGTAVVVRRRASIGTGSTTSSRIGSGS